MDAIDVSIVAGRRPDLLERTLASFEENLFRNFEIARVIANIDPIFGDEADHLKCIDLIRAMDSDALVSEPEEPGFGAAVKRTWSSTQASVILHLEDDWLLNYPIMPKDIAIFDSEPRVMQAAFNHHYKFWDTRERGPYRVARRRIKVLGFETPFKRRYPDFTTSPGFLRGDFARRCAALMNPAYDPEKQFTNRKNEDLMAFASDYRIALIGNGPTFPISDIGREWRDARSITKTIVDGVSIWS